MKEVLYIVGGAGFTVAVAIALGSLLLRALRIELFRVEAVLFEFIAGSGLLSFLVAMLCFLQQARRGVFVGTGILAIAAAVRVGRGRSRRTTLPAVSLNWVIPFSLIFGALFIYYFFNALAPEVSPDGSGNFQVTVPIDDDVTLVEVVASDVTGAELHVQRVIVRD